MIRLMKADAVRMYRGRWFWLCSAGMLALAVGFMIMQHTAMDYSVPLSRVIFLPMSFYGVVAAALVSMFVGEDFSDGFIRNKLIAGRSRVSVFASNLIVSCSACVCIYAVTTLFTYCISLYCFSVDVTITAFLRFFLMGVWMALAYGSIFCAITMLVGRKATSVVICMGAAIAALLVCLHTNQVMVQPEYKDGLLNPHYVSGARKALYAVLHDLNPSGQAAQLSMMKIFHPIRWLICDVVWILASMAGAVLFQRADIS